MIRTHTNPYKKDNPSFGWSIAVSGNLLFVGAPFGNADNDATTGTVDQGFVEVFEIKHSGIVKYTKKGNAFSNA